MLLVVAGGYALWRATSADAAPAREFMELELAAGDAADTGTCYSLSTVLIANGTPPDAARSWSAPEGSRGREWTLLLENVRQGYGGPEREFRQYTFARRGDRVRLIAVEASKGHPTEVGAAIDDLLAEPHARRSTPLERCRQPNAHGYQFPAK